MAALLFLAGCKKESTPETAFKEMQEVACRGDVVAFESYLDSTAITENIVTETIKEDGSRMKYQDSLRSVAKGKVDEGIERWLDDVKHRDAGVFCRSTDIKWTGFAWVSFVDGEGSSRRWRFEPAGETFIVVEMQAN